MAWCISIQHKEIGSSFSVHCACCLQQTLRQSAGISLADLLPTRILEKGKNRAGVYESEAVRIHRFCPELPTLTRGTHQGDESSA